jgi:hypothetical protein
VPSRDCKPHLGTLSTLRDARPQPRSLEVGADMSQRFGADGAWHENSEIRFSSYRIFGFHCGMNSYSDIVGCRTVYYYSEERIYDLWSVRH